MTGTTTAPAGVDLADEPALVAALRAGDGVAFAALVDQYSAAMLQVALLHVASRAVAEEVVQETWIGVIRGLGGFEGRSSLRTWMFRIVTNIAKTRGQRERRTMPLSAVPAPGMPDGFVDPERFFDDEHRWAGHWVTPPRSWDELPEARLLSTEMQERIERAIDGLPQRQRAVIRLRDIHGWTAREVCDRLDLSEANQRVLLHRARSTVRRILEAYINEQVVAE